MRSPAVPQCHRFAVAVAHRSRRGERTVPVGRRLRKVAETALHRADHPLRERPEGRHVRHEGELEASLRGYLGAEHVLGLEPAGSEHHVRADPTRDRAELFRLDRAGFRERHALVELPALELDAGARDRRIEPRDLVTLRGKLLAVGKGLLGRGEVAEPGQGHGEETREDRGREGISLSLHRRERLARLLRAFAQLPAEHHPNAHKCLWDRVGDRIAKLLPDPLGVVERASQARARLRVLSAPATNEGDPEVRIRDEPRVVAIGGLRDDALEQIDVLVRRGEGPADLRHAERRAQTKLYPRIAGEQRDRALEE